MKFSLRSPLLAASLVPYMLFFINPTFPASVSSTGSCISTGLWAFLWKYARDTSMCMIEKTSLCGLLQSMILLHAGLAEYHFWTLSHLVFPIATFYSLATIRDLICIGSHSNALSVSTHFVSTGVIPYFSTASFSSTFSYTPR